MEETKSSRVVLWVTGIHVGVVLIVILVSVLRGCWIRPTEPKQIVSFVELVEPEPAPIEAPPEPAPPEPEPPAPEPPPKPKPIPKKVEISKKRVKRAPPEKPKPPPRKRLTAEEIRKNLALENAKPRPQAVPDDRAFQLYYAMVRRVVYGAWQKPSSATVAPGISAKVLMVVQRDGTISRVSLARSSGNAMLDASALTAVRSVQKLTPLPETYRGRSKEITIDFELTGSGV